MKRAFLISFLVSSFVFSALVLWLYLTTSMEQPTDLRVISAQRALVAYLSGSVRLLVLLFTLISLGLYWLAQRLEIKLLAFASGMTGGVVTGAVCLWVCSRMLGVIG